MPIQIDTQISPGQSIHVLTTTQRSYERTHARTGGMGAWVAAKERTSHNLLSLNKEGVGSLGGYWALAVTGAALGAHLAGDSMAHAAAATAAACNTLRNSGGTSRPGGPRSSAARNTRWRLLSAFGWPLGSVGQVCAVLVATTAAAHVLVEPVSRRSANLAYVLWVAAHCTATLLLLLIAQLVLPGGLRPEIPLAMSRNMLPLFLLANLLTGAVNFTMDTLAVCAFISQPCACAACWQHVLASGCDCNPHSLAWDVVCPFACSCRARVSGSTLTHAARAVSLPCRHRNRNTSSREPVGPGQSQLATFNASGSQQNQRIQPTQLEVKATKGARCCQTRCRGWW